MERRRVLAIVMTVMMVISLIPSMVFAAAPSGELGGKPDFPSQRKTV